MKRFAAVTLAVLVTCGALATPVSASEKNITKANMFGCRDKTTYKKIMGFAYDKDQVAFEQALTRGVLSGGCTIFTKGEPVFLVDIEMFSGIANVRRKGEKSEYWLDSTAIR